MNPDANVALPKTLALIDDDAEYGEFLAQHLASLGIAVQRFADGNELLCSASPFDFGFYIVDLMLPGIDGVDLIGLLRRRTQAGIVVVSGRTAPDMFATVIDGGADMYLAKPVQFEQIVVAIRAVYRRIAAPAARAWLLDVRGSRLVAPDAVSISLSGTDLAVMQCLLQARGGAVTREALCRRLGYANNADAENLLSATIYRLRRRLERATPLPVPLHTQARVGYLFRGDLRSA